MIYLRGFMMAWGNFTAIPCPYKKWHEDARRAMLCMLPLMGVFLAGILVGVWALLDLINAPAILTGVLLTVIYFCCTGFIHLDGFMDCSDAILSRRPLEERQRILKDSTVGAFAVVALVLMLLTFAVSMTVIAEDFTLRKACVLIVIMSISRGIAADEVMRKPTMNSSQYVDLGGVYKVGRNKKKNNYTYVGEQIMINGMTIIPFILIGVICSSYRDLSENFSHLQTGAGYEFLHSYVILICGVGIATMIAVYLTGIYDRKQLGGMSGDIAGHMIVVSEVIGITVAALIAGALL